MKKNSKAGFYPILINLQRFKCIVVGGGKVAHRKVCSLLKFNADITVISPKFSKSILELARLKKIKIIKKAYSGKFIDDFDVVFGATDNHNVNRTVRKDCTEKGILLNVADDPSLCDFILPANVLRGDLTISISSQGKAPFLAKEMRKKIENQISPVFEDIFRLGGELRKRIILDKKVDLKTKDRILRQFVLKNWEKIITANGRKNYRKYKKEILSEFNLV